MTTPVPPPGPPNPNFNPNNPQPISDNMHNLSLNHPPPLRPSPSFPPGMPSMPPPVSQVPPGFRPPPPNFPPNRKIAPPPRAVNPGPPSFPPGGLPRFPPPPAGIGSQPLPPPLLRPPPGMGLPGDPRQPQTMHALLGNSPPSPGMQPQRSQFAGRAQPPPVAPYGSQPWAMQPNQVPPGPTMSQSRQAPRMYGMPTPMPNQSMTAISHAVGQSGAPVAGPSKIDPNHIPQPAPDSSVVLHETRQGNQANPPPSATSDYIVRDTGNCSPRNMRCTINQIPCTADLLTTSGMHLALLVQPLGLPHPSEEPIQVVDLGESGPLRCSRCKAYINPFMKFTDQGRQFICNLCGYTDETPRDYHCNLGPDGRRRDADERPELCRGMVEFVAPK